MNDSDDITFIDGIHYGFWGEARLIVSANALGLVRVSVVHDDTEDLHLNLEPDQAHWLGTKLRLAAKKASATEIAP